jgi:diguanylate cyclase (GGDEF)-like protein
MINDIIKETITKLRSEGKNLTPDNYLEAFCNNAKKRGVSMQDCNKLQYYLDKLDANTKKELKKFNVKSVDELFMFLSSQLKRSNPTQANETITILTGLTKRLLQSISLLHDKKAKALANSTLERIDKFADNKSLDMFKDKWSEFYNSYNDEYLKKIDFYCKIPKDDLQAMSESIVKCFEKSDSSKILESLGGVIIDSLKPSITRSLDGEITKFAQKIKNEPKVLSTSAVQSEIKNIIFKRIDLDNKEVRGRITELDKILSDISEKVIALIGDTDSSNKSVVKIKGELTKIDFKKDTFESIQQKLLTIATSLELETSTLSQKMQQSNEKISKLHQRVKKLEEALMQARKESNEDYLTKVATKRALDNELNRLEGEFTRYGTDYSICFIDIDYFKKINDTYGHEAGDVILRSIGIVLKKFTRDADIVGRYGGEEFLIALPNTSLKDAVAFANKINKAIAGYKFVYKNEKISVRVSGGVAFRRDCSSLHDTIKKADELLYKAKENGRDQIWPKL